MSREKQIIEIKECIDSVYGADCAYFDVDGFAIANKIYDAGYRKQEWISVMDELPEAYIDVLYFDGQLIGVDFICSDGTWCDEEVRNNKVTHWMPLPEAPKMKGGAK